MIEFRGTYFDGRRSIPYEAFFTFDGKLLRIQVKDKSLERQVPLRYCRIDPPLGKTVRLIRLPDGAVCETDDMSALAALETAYGKNRGMRLVHRIESHWKMVILSLAGIVFSVWLFKVYAIPYLAKEIAFATPPAVAEELSRRTLKVLDENYLRPTTLGDRRTDELTDSFHKLLEDLDSSDFDYRLEFRKSPVVGPNAFALPSGQIVMTDELVRLSENDREIEGILLHEIGHVQDRHGLRMVIQDAGMFLILAALLGDLTEISSTAASLPTILARSDYSREFERAADRFSAEHFVSRGWDLTPIENILQRISKDVPNFPGESVLSTHPVMEERIRFFRTFADHQPQGTTKRNEE